MDHDPLHEDRDDGGATCPLCDGPGCLLGTLGRRIHFRCRNCGMDFSRLVEAQEDVRDAVAP